MQPLKFGNGYTKFHPTLYWACDYFSMLELNSIHLKGAADVATTTIKTIQIMLLHWSCMTPKWTQNQCSLRWRHNGSDGVSNLQPHACLLNRLFRHRSKKTSKPRVTGLCVGKSPVTGEFPAQRASNAENVFIWWRHHVAWISISQFWWLKVFTRYNTS